MTTTPPTRIGKTTVAASVGSIFVQLRQDGRVVAIDADTSFGKLAAGSTPTRSVRTGTWPLMTTSTPSPTCAPRSAPTPTDCSPCARVVPHCEADEGRWPYRQGHRQIPRREPGDVISVPRHRPCCLTG